jgi:hypothetical protein
VAGAVTEHVGQLVDVARHVGADVDHRVPALPVVERGVVTTRSIADAVLDAVSEEPAIGAPRWNTVTVWPAPTARSTACRPTTEVTPMNKNRTFLHLDLRTTRTPTHRPSEDPDSHR